jgi:hypothetical protein
MVTAVRFSVRVARPNQFCPLFSLCRNIFILSSLFRQLPTTWQHQYVREIRLFQHVQYLRLADGSTLVLWYRWRTASRLSWETTGKLVNAVYHVDNNLCDGAWIDAGVNIWKARRKKSQSILNMYVSQATGRASGITFARIVSLECTGLEIVASEKVGQKSDA